MMRCVLLAALVLWCPSSAAAQDGGPAFRPGQLTVSAGGVFAAGYGIGDMTANLRRNAAGTPSPFALLRAESKIERAAGATVRVGVALSRSVEIEAGGSYMTPQLGVTISQDDELGEGAFASEQLEQYAVDVSGLYLIPRLSVGSRLRPYAIAGGGYLRQLHEGRLRVETGGTVHIGAGLRYWVRGGRSNQRPFGARAEVRYVRRTGGIEFDERARSVPSVSVLAFVAF
jgi:hypothetical protein